MRVVSMVPSWTETLLKCGVNVVGRTRFCIHPKESVASISVVGGTKDWNWPGVLAVKPDLILLDSQENPKLMSEQSSISWHATHVTDIADLPSTLNTLAGVIRCEALRDLAARWNSVCVQSSSPPINNFANVPGIIDWGLRPPRPPLTILYVIWKNPWMCVSRDTFIGSVLSKVGIEIPKFATKYPEIDLADFDPEETLLLLSSEPYPFLQRKRDLTGMKFPHAFVQGEAFSWFGIRSLEFLEPMKALP